MGLVVEDVQFLNVDLGETIPTDHLLDNLGEVVTATIKVRFDGDYVIATSMTPEEGNTVLIKGADSIYTEQIQDDRSLWTDKPDGFENFKEGDEVTLLNPANPTETKTIIEIISSQLIIVDSAWISSGVMAVDALVFVSTPMQSIEYFFGLIENSEQPNYESKTDGKERRSRASGLSSTTLTDTPMLQLGAKSNQYGALSIKGNEIGDGPPSPQVSQAFIITHTFVVGPLSLADEVNDSKDGVVPEIFRDTNSLKYVFQAEMSKDLTDPNRKKEVTDFQKLGNCGYLGENFNTGLTNYSISNVVYKRANLDINKGIEVVTDETTIEFDILNTEDNPFSDGNTLFVFSHWFMAKPESEYREPELATGNN